MGQKRAFKRFKLVPILTAGVIGYLLGAWNVTGLRSAGSSVADTVALRFPIDWDGLPPVAATRAIAADDPRFEQAPSAAATKSSQARAQAPAATGSGTVMSEAQFALFSPTPMIPTAPQRPPVQLASAEDVAVAPTPNPVPPQSPSPTVQDRREIRPAARASAIRAAVASIRRRLDRPRPVLDDAQIANIKRRLHLTPDQERMWPAVEVALRNLAYKTEEDARRRGTVANSSQLAAADPNSAEVQNLKSAAIPLIMSFNDQQKDQVRSLAYSMGLNQLASEF